MQIFVRLMTGRNLTLDVESTDFAGKVKDMIYDREGIPWHRQRLIFAGRLLHDNVPIGEQNIARESSLHVIIIPLRE
jgi:hypothetical protein